MPAARNLAGDLAENTSAVSVNLAGQMLWRTLGAAHPIDAHQGESAAMHYGGRSSDAREGSASFLEKRPATFTDKPSWDIRFSNFGIRILERT